MFDMQTHWQIGQIHPAGNGGQLNEETDDQERLAKQRKRVRVPRRTLYIGLSAGQATVDTNGGKLWQNHQIIP